MHIVTASWGYEILQAIPSYYAMFIHGYQWKAEDMYGYQWTSIAIHAHGISIDFWISMPCGYPWISMDVRAMYLWISIDLWIPMGFPWMSMDINGYPWIYSWISMDIHRYLWISMAMGTHGYSMKISGCASISIDIHVFSWISMGVSVDIHECAMDIHGYS